MDGTRWKARLGMSDDYRRLGEFAWAIDVGRVVLGVLVGGSISLAATVIWTFFR